MSTTPAALSALGPATLLGRPRSGSQGSSGSLGSGFALSRNASDDSALDRLVTFGRSASVASTAKVLGGSLGFRCCGVHVSGNAASLLVAFCLFSTITVLQYYFAVKANSDALKADCVSMAVDSIAFLANLFAECLPKDAALGKRRVELTMSGLSHVLLLGFTVSFILQGWKNAKARGCDETKDVNGEIVLAFALGGLVFDAVSLAFAYRYGDHAKGRRKESAYPGGGGSNPSSGLGHPEIGMLEGLEGRPGLIEGPGGGGEGLEDDRPREDQLTCGVNTNMCAALLHVVSDLLRSTTTLVEALVLLLVVDRGHGTAGDLCSTRVDGVATLVVCSVIVAGAAVALFAWAYEVKLHLADGGARREMHESGSGRRAASFEPFGQSSLKAPLVGE